MSAFRKAVGVLGAVVVAACGATDITVENLEGTWEATAYVFTNPDNTSQQVDIIDVSGASMTLVVQANGNTTSTFNDGVDGSSSDSGTFTAEGTSLTLAGVTYEASLSGDRLTLESGTGEYDFDGDGSDDPATVRITLQRQ